MTNRPCHFRYSMLEASPTFVDPLAVPEEGSRAYDTLVINNQSRISNARTIDFMAIRETNIRNTEDFTDDILLEKTESPLSNLDR